MINTIQNIGKIQQVLDNAKTTEFNSTLPVGIKILKKMTGLKFWAQLGNIEMEVKSYKNLQVGQRYWAEMKNSTGGGQNAILIQNLIKQPNLFKNDPQFMFSLQQFQEILQNDEKKPGENFKNFLLERLALTNDKAEFQFTSNLLLSLQHHVLTFPLHYDDRQGFAQIKKQKSEKTQQKAIEFYALFQNLGALRGKIFETEDDSLNLHLKSPFKSTLALLNSEEDLLVGFHAVTYELDHDVEPLYDFSDQLLDLKG